MDIIIKLCILKYITEEEFMKRILSLATVFVFSALTVFATGQKPENTAVEQTRAIEKDVEIVFVLDTTGSMGGLIQGAKTKIWSIVN